MGETLEREWLGAAVCRSLDDMVSESYSGSIITLTGVVVNGGVLLQGPSLSGVGPTRCRTLLLLLVGFRVITFSTRQVNIRQSHTRVDL